MLNQFKNFGVTTSLLMALTTSAIGDPVSRSPVTLNQNLKQPLLGAMDLLNGLPALYPQAISLAPGKPADEFCTPAVMDEAVEIYRQYAEKTSSIPVDRLLGQYGKCSGIINELIAKHLKVDEGMEVDAHDILVTVGFQEAATLLSLTLFNEGDVLLTPDPGYIGMTGIATLAGIDVQPVNWVDGFDYHRLEKTLQDLLRQGKTPKAMYVASSYCNPQGTSLSLSQRYELLALAAQYGFYIIEDATYSLFNYDEEKLLSLKALDKHNRVIYVGSFAKSLFPALRIGYIALNDQEKGLLKGLVKTKSFTTINTPALDQAVVGGILLKNGFSLKEFVRKKKDFFRKNRDVMLETLKSTLSDVEGVEWTEPKGGFFVTVTLPFEFNQEMLQECAEKFGTIVLPMYLLTLDQGPSKQVRLSFTTVNSEKIRVATKQFANYIKSKKRSG